MRLITAITALTLLFSSACRDEKKADKDVPTPDVENPDNPPPVFSMTVPEADRAKSNYCGQETPPIPEDPTPSYRFDKDLIESKLQGDGLTGWVHGAVPMYNHFIFTYRLEDPDDFMAFFKAQQFTMIPMTAEVRALLPTLNRHDKIRLKGSFFENGSPMPHLKITSIDMIKKYPDATDNSYLFDMEKLKGQKKLEVFGQIHAMVYSEQLGYGIVVEHGDALLPVGVDPAHAEVAAKLFRSDIVNISLKVVETPHSPPHFVTDGDIPQAIKLVDPVVNCHSLDRTVEGFLVKFKKSPAIFSDTYGVRVVDANLIARNFTFFPGDHGDGMIALNKAISLKAKQSWDASEEEPTIVRNYFKKEGVRVKVSGRLNVESPDQANPQIYINKIEDLTFDTVK